MTFTTQSCQHINITRIAPYSDIINTIENKICDNQYTNRIVFIIVTFVVNSPARLDNTDDGLMVGLDVGE